MTQRSLETLIGAIVIAIAVGFIWFAYSTTNETGISGYEVSAVFSRVDGINPGSDVRLSGIKVGTVSALVLNPKTYEAVAQLSIKNGIKLPVDSSIKITSSGILGSAYLSITPGGSNRMIPPGGSIANTQGSVDLMGLIGRMITGGGKG
ncbi:MAG: outer membrane lipid asymmetry maintenance protein MlaD [Alphaproteobacteria bacterium]|nr:outer membrane lipid asymmetry maintenance protein MlaD [Alphaproteobacteria bacterium]